MRESLPSTLFECSNPTDSQVAPGQACARGLLVEQASVDQAFAKAVMPAALATIERVGEGRDRLVEAIIAHGKAVAATGRVDRVKGLFEGVLDAMPHDEAKSARTRIIDSIRSPRELTDELHLYVLLHVARDRPVLSDAAKRWLEAPAQRINLILDLDLPRSWHLAACEILLRTGEPPAELTKALERRPALGLELLRDLVCHGSSPEAALRRTTRGRSRRIVGCGTL